MSTERQSKVRLPWTVDFRTEFENFGKMLITLFNLLAWEINICVNSVNCIVEHIEHEPEFQKVALAEHNLKTNFHNIQ